MRDAESLGTLYPATLTHLTKLKISRNGVPIGWAVVAERRTNSLGETTEWGPSLTLGIL